MDFLFVLLNLYPIVLLSSRECNLPIQLRPWCRNHIGVFPFGLYPGGFLCFTSAFSGLHHHRDRDHDFIFFKSRMDLQTQIWDPGASNYKKEKGEIRLWTNHICGSRFVFVSEFGFWILLRSKTSVTLSIVVGTLFLLLFMSVGIREMLAFKSRNINLRFEAMVALPQSDHIVASVHDYIVCDYFHCGMELRLHQFGFCWIEMSKLHVVSVNFWRQFLVGIAQIWSLEHIALATFRWESIDMRGSCIWDTSVNLLVIMVERSTKLEYFTKIVVRKFWCHYVYISELVLDTSALMLRFVKRRFSHKLLHTNRNKEKSNMKLDNNRSFDWLASKTTLRTASSNSLLLYFLFVYGTYICVCNNCVTVILHISLYKLL